MQPIKWNRVLMALGAIALLLCLSFYIAALWLLDKRDTEIKRRMTAPAREGLAAKRSNNLQVEREDPPGQEEKEIKLPVNGTSHVDDTGG